MKDYVHEISTDESLRIQKFIYWLAGCSLVFTALVIALFITAGSWLKLIEPASEKRFSDPYIKLARDMMFNDTDPRLQAYVEQLTNTLAAHMQIPRGLVLTVVAIEGSTINAFTTLGGYIFITEGLVSALDNENSLAMVLAHEIAHAAKRDPLLSTGRGVLISLLLSSLSGGGVDRGTAGDLGSQLMLNAYSRDQEEHADLLALDALQKMYGHVGGATQLFEAVGDEEETMGMELLASHPDLVRRIAYLREESNRQGWADLATRPYPENITELLKTP